ncbi:MAG TPA: histidine phosphatase family protein [Candidatus Dormibacteraeota bacterium]
MSDVPIRTRLYLVRHCQVRNPDGILYGHLPDFPLSEAGVQQAHRLGRHLAAAPARQIYTSPLERAVQTAEIISSHLDGATITVTDELTEARFGLYLQGVRPRDVLWRRPLWFVHMMRPGLLGRDERVAGMAARVAAPLHRLLTDHPGTGGICVSHGDPIQAFWVKADGRRDWSLHRLQCAKGGMLVLDYEGERLAGRRYVPPEEVDDPGPERATAGVGAAEGSASVSAADATQA